MELGPDSVQNLDRALDLEWLETNGLGSFACGTVIGANTRRYHGLLTLAQNPPGGRVVLLSGLEEQIHVGDKTFDLSSHLYTDVLHPFGYRQLTGFSTDPWPTWTFEAAGWRLRREVLMPQGVQATLIAYTLEQADHPLWLTVRPLVAGRGYHFLRRVHGDATPAVRAEANRLVVAMEGGLVTCTLEVPFADVYPEPRWYFRFRYPIEQQRGLEAVEDLFSPGQLRWLLVPGETIYMAASNTATSLDLPAKVEEERERRARIDAGAASGDEVGRRLRRAADQFVCRRSLGGRGLTTLMAGYPWFMDWGRDALISLPGLLIATGRLGEAREVIEVYLGSMRRGLVPNCFSDDGSGSAYNSIDATLWLFLRAREYMEAADDDDFASSAYPALRASRDALARGTDYGIGLDADGLLRAGTPDTQLTWMDAQVKGRPVTPRFPKPVEIEALWYSALRSVEWFARRAGDEDEARSSAALANRVAKAFLAAFWDAGRGYLADCLTQDATDWSLRPNQVIALSLPDGLVPEDIARAALAVVDDQLLTPYGLRTLAPADPRYRADYQGAPDVRDSGYHQGTVWPWLIGPYVQAKMALLGDTPDARRWARKTLDGLVGHLDAACLGQVSEIFDAEPPHHPRGCFAQAWSVAEVLRLWVAYRLWEVD